MGGKKYQISTLAKKCPDCRTTVLEDEAELISNDHGRSVDHFHMIMKWILEKEYLKAIVVCIINVIGLKNVMFLGKELTHYVKYI